MVDLQAPDLVQVRREVTADAAEPVTGVQLELLGKSWCGGHAETALTNVLQILNEIAFWITWKPYAPASWKFGEQQGAPAGLPKEVPDRRGAFRVQRVHGELGNPGQAGHAVLVLNLAHLVLVLVVGEEADASESHVGPPIHPTVDLPSEGGVRGARRRGAGRHGVWDGRSMVTFKYEIHSINDPTKRTLKCAT